MFYGNMPEEGDVIIPDLHPDGFRKFLSYLYSHEAKFADVETALLTKSAAQKYLDLNLVGLCTEFVRKSIKPETLCFVLDVLAVSDEPMSEYDGAINETLRTSADPPANEEHIACLESRRREQNQRCKRRRRATEVKRKREARRRQHSTPAEQFPWFPCATARFRREFVENPFGVTCAVCDRLCTSFRSTHLVTTLNERRDFRSLRGD
ncbi:hypothetical protein HPB47_016547 [Ixodes persulcatus]|uniref:Uncharacterized protein n=1 Tax=Ixodes persulcatus TaxID=34615 RepID=A0AC60R0C8_IXOPE|nr:hypothetical protein HPB47_016547 [Ixodes persulcatus]